MKIDWEEIHRRLSASDELLERGWTPLPGERRALLKARAKALAREPETQHTAAERLDVVEFLLAHERYAFESSHVREVCPLRHFTPVPCTPAFVLGIINVRGQIISVVDLKKFLNLPEKGLTDLNKVIIIHNKKMEFGILADLILGMRSISATDLQPPLTAMTGLQAEYVRGITRERLVILSAETILNDRRILVHE